MNHFWNISKRVHDGGAMQKAGKTAGTGKTIVLTIQTFVGRVMSLLFNTLSRLVIAFLPRSSHGKYTGVVCHSIL